MSQNALLNEADAKPDGPKRAPHERIVDVAREMFCRDGIHATGIDRILAAAQASKMTLYARFGSKEALVREVLQQEGTEWRARFFAALCLAEDPRERLLRVVPALAEWFQGERFYGCAFMNAVAEHTKGQPWLRELAAAHHREIIAFLAAQARAAGMAEPDILARQILLLIDGAIAATMVSGDPGVLAIAERNLRAILGSK
jgi:AcrR family transcriptional regulator